MLSLRCYSGDTNVRYPTVDLEQRHLIQHNDDDDIRQWMAELDEPKQKQHLQHLQQQQMTMSVASMQLQSVHMSFRAMDSLPTPIAFTEAASQKSATETPRTGYSQPLPLWALSSYPSQLLDDHMAQPAMPNIFDSQGTIRASVLGRRLAT